MPKVSTMPPIDTTRALKLNAIRICAMATTTIGRHDAPGLKTRWWKPSQRSDERLDPEAARPGVEVLPLLVAEASRAGDVEVRPAHAVGHELAQEEAGGDGAGEPARREVVEVGVGRLERLLVFLDERQLPDRLAVALAGADHAAHQLAVAAHDAGDARPERADDRAGQGGRRRPCASRPPPRRGRSRPSARGGPPRRCCRPSPTSRSCRRRCRRGAALARPACSRRSTGCPPP